MRCQSKTRTLPVEAFRAPAGREKPSGEGGWGSDALAWQDCLAPKDKTVQSLASRCRPSRDGRGVGTEMAFGRRDVQKARRPAEAGTPREGAMRVERSRITLLIGSGAVALGLAASFSRLARGAGLPEVVVHRGPT